MDTQVGELTSLPLEPLVGSPTGGWQQETTLCEFLSGPRLDFTKFPHEVVIRSPAFKEPIAFEVSGGGRLLYTPTDQKVIVTSIKTGQLKGTGPQAGRQIPVVALSGQMVTEAIKTEDVSQEVFHDRKIAPKEVQFSPGYVSGVGYFATDPWSVVATGYAIANQVGNVSIDTGVSNKFTSTFSLVTGPICMVSAMQTARQAARIGDIEGVSNQRIRLVRGGVETTSGAVMGAVRGVGIAAARPTAAKSIVTASRILGYASTAVGGVLYFLLLLPFAIDAVRGGKFLHQLNQKLKISPHEAWEFLKDQVGLTPKDFEKIEKSTQFQGQGELLRLIKDEQVISKEELLTLTPTEIQHIKDAVTRQMETLNSNEYDQISDWNQVKDCLVAKALKKAALLVEKKGAEYTRRAGAGSYTDLRKILKSEEVVSEEKMGSILALVKKEAKSQLALRSLVIFICLLGIGAMIATTVFTGGVPLLAALVAMFVMNILMSGLDFYSFVQELKSLKRATKLDVVLQTIFLIMTIVSVSVALVFSAGVVAPAVIGTLAVIMLVFQIGALDYTIGKYREKNKINLSVAPIVVGRAAGPFPELPV